MPDNISPPQALPEQIVLKMLETLQQYPEFDEAMLQKLSQLASKGNLKKPAQVAKAIRATQEGKL